MIRDDRKERCGLVAAYRDGLGLFAIAVFAGADATRIIALRPGEPGSGAAADGVYARFWCRRADDAARLASAAARTLRRESSGQLARTATLPRASAALLQAAKRLAIALYRDDDLAAEAMQVAARIDLELHAQQQSGGLKSVNRAYRLYRLETSGRGERVLRYDEWMRKYRENLVREVASALRLI